MEKLLKIGEFAKLNNISIQTLRYYESIELVQPEYIDEKNHFRYYHILQSNIIDTIQFLKNLDFNLYEIKDIMSHTNDANFLSSIVKDKESELLAKKEEIDNKLAQIKGFNAANKIYTMNFSNETLDLHRFPDRFIFPFRSQKNIYSMSEEEYESTLRTFKQFFNKQSLPKPAFSQVGSIMSGRNFRQGNYFSDTMFVFVDKDKRNKQIKKVTKGLYAIYYCKSFGEELGKIDEFKQELKKNGLIVVGDYICEVIFELPKPGRRHRNMFIRMQIPVKRSLLGER